MRGAILTITLLMKFQDVAQQIASGHASVHFGPFQDEEEVNRVHWRNFATQAKRESEPTTISESIVWSANPSRFVVGEQLGGRSPAGFILEIDISERLFMGEAVVAPAKTAVLPV